MSVKHQPATPLPFRLYSDCGTIEIAPPPPANLGERPSVVFWGGFDGNGFTRSVNEQNAAYLIHAANAYPKLVEALRAMLYLQRAVAPTAQSRAAILGHTSAILRELGEA